MNYVAFPTWTERNGQDDLVWSYVKVINGIAEYRVNISDHNYDYGKYITHIYAYDKAGKYSVYGLEQNMIPPVGVPGWKEENGRKYIYDKSGTLVEGGRYLVIDVSKWQGNVNWDLVAKDSMVDAVILRISHGTQIDKLVTSYVKELNRLNIPYGFYHYNTAKTTTEALMQAQLAINYIKSIGGKPAFPVYADIEEGGSDRNQTAIAKTYCDYFISQGYAAGVYANLNYWSNYLDESALSCYSKWIANYGVNDGMPKNGWRPDESFCMWQYTSKGSIPGIDGNVDMNIMFE